MTAWQSVKRPFPAVSSVVRTLGVTLDADLPFDHRALWTCHFCVEGFFYAPYMSMHSSLQSDSSSYAGSCYLLIIWRCEQAIFVWKVLLYAIHKCACIHPFKAISVHTMVHATFWSSGAVNMQFVCVRLFCYAPYKNVHAFIHPFKAIPLHTLVHGLLGHRPDGPVCGLADKGDATKPLVSCCSTPPRP